MLPQPNRARIPESLSPNSRPHVHKLPAPLLKARNPLALKPQLIPREGLPRRRGGGANRLAPRFSIALALAPLAVEVPLPALLDVLGRPGGRGWSGGAGFYLEVLALFFI